MDSLADLSPAERNSSPAGPALPWGDPFAIPPLPASPDSIPPDSNASLSNPPADSQAGTGAPLIQEKPVLENDEESGIGRGLMLMVVGVVWFVAGLLLNNRIPWFPVILFIMGLVGLLKGLAIRAVATR